MQGEEQRSRTETWGSIVRQAASTDYSGAVRIMFLLLNEREKF